MNNTNKDYYKQVYDKVHASEELKERLMDMRGENKGTKAEKNKRKHVMWKAAAAVVLAITIPTGVYAATHHLNINELINGGLLGYRPLSEEATNLVERKIRQTKEDTAEEMPVEFTVREALCDSRSVNMVVEVRAKEKGKYLLLSHYCAEDSVSFLGIEGDETLGEYAKRKGLEILYVDAAFAEDSPFNPVGWDACDNLVEDDVLELGIETHRTDEQQNLNVILDTTVSKKFAASAEEMLLSKNTFKLQDKSSSETVAYTAHEEMKIQGTSQSAVVTEVKMISTEVRTYLDIYYTNYDYDCTDPNSDEDDIMFRIKDSGDADHRWSLDDTGIVRSLGNGKYCRELEFDPGTLPQEFVLEAYDGNSHSREAYVQFELSREE